VTSAPTKLPVIEQPAQPRLSRRLNRRRWADRITPALVFGVLAGLVAFVLVASVLRDRREMVSVVVAAEPIAVGQPVTLDVVRVVEVPASNGIAAGLLTPADVAAGGVVASRALVAAEPVVRSSVGESTGRAASRVMSLPLSDWGASGGELQVGDRIDVIDTRADTTVFVVRSALVVARSSDADGGGGLAGAPRGVWVAIEVSDADALALAAVVEADRFVIVRSTGVDR
jgi:hypothetical protein